MVLLITSTALGVALLAVGIILHLSLPGWVFLSGLGAYPAARRENIKIPKLRRRLSMLFYGVAAAFLAGSLLLSVKAISPEYLFTALPVVLFVAIDCIWILYRIYDGNTYPQHVRRALLLSFSILNAGFVALFFLYIRK